MKNKVLKKTLAAALALTLVGGGLPALTGGADIFKSAIVANAIDGLAPEVGKVYNWGQRIQLGELYLEDDYLCANYNDLIHNYITIEEPKYLDDKDMWSVGYAEGAALCALKSDADRHYEIPIGVKIVSGTGAYNDPFTMELVYSGDAVTPEEVTVGKKWYVGDTINTDAYFIGERVQVYGESNDPTSFSPGGNSCEFHLINKKLTSAYKLHAHSDDEDRLVFPDTVSTTYTDLGIAGDGYPTGLAFEITSEDIIGIEVTGGKGTKDEPFTIAPIKHDKLADGKYTQTATKDGKNYTRFVFVKPKSEIEGKSKAVFSATLNGNTKTFETSTYYTGMTSNGEYFTPASDDSVMFVVTVSSTSSLDGLTCTLDFE